MTSKKRYKKQISSYEELIQCHLEKIEQEKLKDLPDFGKIRHWEKEVEVHKNEIKKAEKRLKRG